MSFLLTLLLTVAAQAVAASPRFGPQTPLPLVPMLEEMVKANRGEQFFAFCEPAAGPELFVTYIPTAQDWKAIRAACGSNGPIKVHITWGDARFENGTFVFAVHKPRPGLAKKLSKAIRVLTGRAAKVKVVASKAKPASGTKGLQQTFKKVTPKPADGGDDEQSAP